MKTITRKSNVKTELHPALNAEAEGFDSALSAQWAEDKKALTDNPEKVERLCGLYSRWMDEREYEDFKNYEVELRKLLDGMPRFRVVRGSKRPFGLEVAWKHTLGTRSLEIGAKMFINLSYCGFKPLSIRLSNV